MRGWAALVLTIAAAGCQKPASLRGNEGATTAALPQGTDTSRLAPGEWEITTVDVPPPGAPGAPRTSTDTTTLSVEDALNPPPGFFGACDTGTLQMSGGSIHGNMPCHGEGALSNASVTVTGSYTRTSFQVTVELHFMRITTRQERRGRFLRAN